MTSATTLWYLTRGSGAVALVLLTVSILLGIVTSLRVQVRNWPRFAIGSLHRSLTLLSIVFVVLHVVTTVADGYAPIGLQDAIVPFASPYRPIWLGLGAVAFDLLLALVVTSLLRQRIGARLWRAVHWLAYASWPVALVHAFGTGSDATSAWLVALGIGCVGAVVAATLLRIAVGGGPRRIRIAGAVAAVALPIALLIGYADGPAKTGWAARAGTPTRLRASSRAVTSPTRVLTTVSVPPRSFSTTASGSIVQHQTTSGTSTVVIRLTLAGEPRGALRIDLHGESVAGGVGLAASGVSFVPATTRAVYYGTVTGLEGNSVTATVHDANGDRLNLAVSLTLDLTVGTATAHVSATTPHSGESG